MKVEEIGGERDGDFMDNSYNGLFPFLTLEIPLKEGIGGERDGDFMDNSYNGLFPDFGDTT